jgi:predicted peptidase
MKNILLIILFLFSLTAFSQDKNLFQKKEFIQDGDTLPVRIMYPKDFDASKKYPLVLFLHGRGESGNNNESQLTHGAELFMANREKFPAVVVFPQCAKDSYWANVDIKTDEKGKRHFFFKKRGKPTKVMRLLTSYIQELKKDKQIDPNRMYVAGLSMGGMGTYELLRREPKTFAAAIAICGGDNIKNVKKYANRTPLWIFHGAKDDVVVPEFSEAIYKELKRRGADPRYTVYPHANHNSWDPAFKEPDFLKWLFSHSK